LTRGLGGESFALGPALAQAGIEGPPARMEWIEVAAHHTPGS
jgi:hypothetical protein